MSTLRITTDPCNPTSKDNEENGEEVERRFGKLKWLGSLRQKCLQRDYTCTSYDSNIFSPQTSVLSGRTYQYAFCILNDSRYLYYLTHTPFTPFTALAAPTILTT